MRKFPNLTESYIDACDWSIHRKDSTFYYVQGWLRSMWKRHAIGCESFNAQYQAEVFKALQ